MKFGTASDKRTYHQLWSRRFIVFSSTHVAYWQSHRCQRVSKYLLHFNLCFARHGTRCFQRNRGSLILKQGFCFCSTLCNYQLRIQNFWSFLAWWCSGRRLDHHSSLWWSNQVRWNQWCKRWLKTQCCFPIGYIEKMPFLNGWRKRIHGIDDGWNYLLQVMAVLFHSVQLELF